MSEEKKNSDAVRSDDGANFQKARFQARCLALQYLYMCDTAGDWSYDKEHAANFCKFYCDLFEIGSPACFRHARKYAAKILAATCEHKEEIDEMIKNAAVNWALHRMSAVDRSVLRLAICEMRILACVPPGVAINEAIEVARKFGDVDSTKFVNGVLETVRKSMNAVVLPMVEDTETVGDE